MLLEPGMLVALDMEKYSEEKPQIATVLSMEGEEIEVLWYYGTWTGSWRVHKKREGRSFIENTETVPKSSVKLFNFTLTPLNKLRQSVKEQLKLIYKMNDLEAE